MAAIKYYFSRSVALFLLALLTGLILPHGAAIGKALTLPALTIILTITLLRMPRGFFRHPSKLIFPALWGIIMNYLILGNFIIWSGIFLIRQEGFWIGMVLIAAVPPAVSILALNKMLPAQQDTSFAGLAGAYAGGILIAPLIGLGFLKFIPLNYSGIILLVVELIVLPLALSRIAIDKDWDSIIEPHEEIINDWCFFIVFYALASSSLFLIRSHFRDVLYIAVIAAASTFLIGYVIEKVCSFYRVPRGKTISLMFLGTMKNYGLAGGIALTVFNKDAALPATIFAIVFFIYELDLKRRMKKMKFINAGGSSADN
jgi:bile acid:Na+ symporter, BASS family